jgi:2-hydroxy-3-keto-5-methylthiopentenyl-1-phosphate phosphatase
VRAASATPRATSPRWTVLCDFDGTISPTDVTDSLLARFAREGWQELERKWEAGRIGSRACMAGQVALLDCSREELDEHLAKIAIDPDFKAFAAAVQASGSSLAIVSDGLDAAIVSILSAASMPAVPVYASHLVQTGPRSWALEFPHARPDCVSAGATCKCVLARAGSDRPVMMIGDGASDFCVSAASDVTLARAKLLAHCVDEGIAHRPAANFAEALCAWHELAAAVPTHTNSIPEKVTADDRE